MLAKELREKTEQELQEELHSLLKEQFNYRIQKGSGQLPQAHLIKQVRRNIARVKTVLKQKTSGGGND